MVSRRDLVTATLATAAIVGTGRFGRLAAQGRLTQDELLRFPATGNVTLSRPSARSGAIRCC